ncbi:phosphoglucosamine mutase [Natranaerovirga hydrolytica]|uniref:Phosphoglucosamine mutase n=1 Tax=Natranaerovirga hydrolytica TaxID=680378 RepID=A0A4R1MEM6_9FIRM|nr:phosphoglucosamine mutase [Natranaerovirga hydrolytica]TCK90587.1 phosphoglucosamine mutase [Natranaerovirga hydrolytica]
MGRLFGTDGVRGIANQDLTIELAFKLGQAGAYVLTKENKHKPTIIVGRDTRISGEMLTSALIAGICSVGANAIAIGVVPTPAVSYLTKKYKADAGIVVSASHNPVEYNGIKFFNQKGYKLSDAIEEEIESIILDNKEMIQLPTGTDIGTVKYKKESIEEYIDYVKQIVDIDFKGLKVVIDCANGASYASAPETLRQLGAEVYIIHNEPDGKNINKNCGSTHMDDLKNYVIQLKADIGIAFDGDADRCLAVDEKGNLIDGDQIMSICGLFMKENNQLKKDTIVATVMSNLGLSLMGEENDIQIKQTKVGDRYVLEEMVKNSYNLGGEQSGHIIFSDYNTTGDGLITAVHILEVLKRKNKPLSEIAKVMTVLPQVLINAKVDNSKKQDYLKDEVINQAIKKVEEKFEGQGRVLIRPSGTEPLVRVMIEGKDESLLKTEANQLAQLIESRLK